MSPSVFPTRVGVILPHESILVVDDGIPHTGGGDPSLFGVRQHLRRGIPHTGGGDPLGDVWHKESGTYSPHGWG